MTNDEIKGQLNDFEILCLTVIGEGRGEPVEGQIAIANVIMNRSRIQKKSIKEICLAPAQFSCWNETDPNRLLLETLIKEILLGNHEVGFYKQIMYVVGGVYDGKISDNTKGVQNYMTTKLFNSPLRPGWAKKPKAEPFQIGSHTFIRV